MKCYVFAYGTLLDDQNRFEVLGYHTQVYPATIKGYEMSNLTLGHITYPAIVKSPNGNAIVNGGYFEIDVTDLHKLDTYETEAYTRISSELEESVKAWVYIAYPKF